MSPRSLGKLRLFLPASMTSTGMGTLAFDLLVVLGIGAARIARSAMSMTTEPLGSPMSFRSSQVGVIADGAGGCWCSLPATRAAWRDRMVRILPEKRERLSHSGVHVPDISKERSHEAFLHATGRWHSCDRRGCGHLCLGIFHRRQRWDQRPPEAMTLGHPSLVVVDGSPFVAGSGNFMTLPVRSPCTSTGPGL